MSINELDVFLRSPVLAYLVRSDISTLANEPNCHDRIALLIESERHTNGLLGRSLDIRYPLSPRVKGRDREEG